MSAVVVVIGLLVSGQVAQPKDRYGNSIEPPPANSSAAGALDDNQLQPLDQSPAGARPVANPNAAQGTSGVNPFRKQLEQTNSPAAVQSRTSQPNAAVSPPPGIERQQSQAPQNSPARSGSEVAAAPPASTGVKPSAMIKMMLAAPPGAEISGDRATLVDVVAGAPSRLEQTQRVEAYWDLCSAVADYYLSLREQDELRQLRTMLPRVGPTWQQAEAEMAVRMSTSKRAAIASQLRLASWLGRAPGSLPLPADLPHCGSYHTRYDEIFTGRLQSEAQELAALLPLRYAELKDSAAAVTRAQEWLNATARSDTSDGTNTLRGLEFLALRRRAFVQIVRDYNRRIARYTELSTPGAVGAERLVTMLIKRDDLPTATRPSLPGSATGRQSQNGTESLRRTFADEGWESSGKKRASTTRRDDAVEQTSAESSGTQRRERSLLVTPQ
jgi:hypothetical protein